MNRITLLNNKEKINNISSLILLIISSPIINFFLEYRNRDCDLSSALSFCKDQYQLFIYGSIVIFLILMFIFLIINNAYITLSLVWSFSIIFSFVNYTKLIARSEPLLPEDLTLISSTKDLSSMVDKSALTTQFIFIVFIVLFGIIITFALKKLGVSFSINKYLPIRIILSILSIILFFLILTPIQSPADKFIKTKSILNYTFNEWSQKGNYRKNGFITGFIKNLEKVKMRKPNGYSKKKIINIVQKYKKIATEKNIKRQNLKNENINIVYIMNESFTNPEEIKKYYPFTGEEITPNLENIMKNYSSGKIVSPAYGGGTADVEFEALTGLSKYMKGVTLPYQYYLSHIENFPSIVRTLENNFGYNSTAIHPYTTSMFKRTAVYRNMGFDNFYGKKGFTYKHKIENGKYISDKSAYKELIKILTEKNGKKFINLITMQNHMPYGNQYKKYKIKLTADVDKETKKQIKDYLEALKYSDDALKYLINKIGRFKEKTVIVFWGDHLPGIYTNILDSDIKKYNTPIFIYSNFNSKKKTMTNIGIISPNYIPTELYDYLNVKKPPFYYLLDAMKNEYPKLIEALEQKNIETSLTYNDYYMLEYDLLSGKRYSTKTDFFNIS